MIKLFTLSIYIFLMNHSELNGARKDVKASPDLMSKSSVLPPGIYVNEVMASNSNTLLDEFGNASDWIEIYNNTSSNVNLNNYYITDSPSNLIKHKLVSSNDSLVVPANGYLILWADSSPHLGVRHLGFSLSASGEEVVLTSPDGVTVINSLPFAEQYPNISYGLMPASLETRYFSNPTPGLVNNATGAYIGVLEPPTVSINSGSVTSSVSVSASHTDPSVQIFYSKDGTEPKGDHLLGTSYPFKNRYPQNVGEPLYPISSRSIFSYNFTSPVTITNPASSPNNVSTINQTNKRDPFLPSVNIPKIGIISFAATKEGYMPSKTVSRAFAFNNTHTLPITAINIQEDYLFEYNNGISIAGKVYEDYFLTGSGFGDEGNFQKRGSANQKRANLSYLSSTTNYDYSIGLRLQGNFSRRDKKKSYRLYFEDVPEFVQHDPSWQIPIKILRKPGPMPRNDIASRIIKGLNIGVRDGFLTAMYLNGEYWGIYSITNYYNNTTLAKIYDLNEDNIDVVKNQQLEDGEMETYESLMNFVNSNNFSGTANYDSLKALIDLNSFVDCIVSELFINNHDWPHNNVTLWRNRSATFKGKPLSYNDGRFRWLVEDQDHSLFGEDENSIDRILNRDSDIARIFKRLNQNNTFKTFFANRVADLCNTALKNDRLLSIIDSIKAEYQTEITNEINRWQDYTSFSSWNSDFNGRRSFLSQRTEYFRNYTRLYKGSYGTFNLTVISNDTTQGFVKVNTININNKTVGIPNDYKQWTGVYFDNVPITISAEAKPGHKFTHWIYNSVPVYTREIIVDATSNRTYTAFFEEVILSENPTPSVAAIIADCSYTLSGWPASSTKGTAPANSAFVYLNMKDPVESSIIEGFTDGVYNLSSGSRINGLGSEGFSFINTGSGNTGYPEGKMGGFLLAINTENTEEVRITWKAKTVTANDRKYKIKMYYREGDNKAFEVFSPSVEYTGSTTSGHTQSFNDILLPASMLNKPYVQLFWKYFHSGIGTSGPRDQLAVSDISVFSVKRYTGNLVNNISSGDYPGRIINSGEVQANQTVENFATQSVLLNPGFSTENNVVFKAEIRVCD